MNTPAPLLAVERLVKHFRLPRESLLSPPRVLEALRGVSDALDLTLSGDFVEIMWFQGFTEYLTPKT